MKKIIIQFITMFTIILLLFKTTNELKNEVYETYIYFIKNVLPTLFPLMIISLYLRENILNKCKNETILYIISTLTFAPSNALIINNTNNILFSSILNPLYSYSIISQIINKTIALKIVITNYIFNNILLFTSIKKNNEHNISHKETLNINKIIKKTVENVINIFGITIFFSIITKILIILKIPKELIIFIDVINGFKIINNINHFKTPLIILLNSFTGLSMLFQIKSINEKINYKFMINKFILSILSLILTLFII